MHSFSSLGLNPRLVQAVSDLGYETPTPIQSAVIPLLLSGQDVIGQAQTGTGKTAAFALPMLHALLPEEHYIRGLVLAPTWKLPFRVAHPTSLYGQHTGARVLAVYGGQPYGPQIRHLRQGVDIIVGTPGRLLDLIRKNLLDLSHLHTLVLDEADEMLSMGFIEDIEAILSAAPVRRQTALFSATMPMPIRRLADRYLNEPRTVAIEHKQRTVEAIEQRVYFVNGRDKLAALLRLLEMEDTESALIFARTRADTGSLANALTSRGFPAEALNGDLSQDAREHVLRRFKQRKIAVLVATDVAARGLDIDHISHVFNYDLPDNPEVYVHRVGRTGRAGKTGIAITLATPQEQGKLRRVENYARQRMTRAVLPTAEEIRASREARFRERLMVWLRRGRGKQERALVESLIAEGHDPLDVAVAALKMARAGEKALPITPIAEVSLERRPRHVRNAARRGERRGERFRRGTRAPRAAARASHERGMVRLVFGAGRQQGIRPSDVVGTIAHHADIPGRSIGAILIQEAHTLVDVQEQFVPQVLAKTGQYRVRRQRIDIERA